MISPVIFQRDEKGYSQFKLLEDDNEILDYIISKENDSAEITGDFEKYFTDSIISSE